MTSTPTPNRISPEDFRELFKNLKQPRPAMRNVAHGFGDMLQKLRVKAGFTLRDLESMSGVPNPVISMIESGKRRCGARAAAKLADALFLGESPEKREFLYAAAATVKARGVIEDAQLYPPAILDVLANKLRLMGIRDRDILGVYVESPPETGSCPDLLIILQGGRRLAASVTVKEVV